MKYSLRSLMIAVTLAAVGMGWWSNRRFCLCRAAECDIRSAKFSLKAMNAGEYCGIERENDEQCRIDASIAEYVRLQKLEKKQSKQYRLAVWRPWLRLTLDTGREVAP